MGLYRKSDLATRERDEVLYTQVMEARKDLNSSAAVTKSLVTTHFSAIGNSVEQIASQAASGHAELQTEIRHGHNSIRQYVSLTQRQGRRKIESLQKDFRNMRSSTRKAQLSHSRELLRLDHSIHRLDSILSGLSSLHISSERADSSSALIQHSGLEGMMLSLMLMRTSLYDAVSNLRSEQQTSISKDGIGLLLAEYQDLVAFCHKAAAIRINRRSGNLGDESGELKTLSARGSMSTEYSVAIDSLSRSENGPKYRWCTKSFSSRLGRLILRFLEEIGDYSSLPSKTVGASFLFIPSMDVHSTGVYASFQKQMRTAQKPSIARVLRVVRYISTDAIIAIMNDDLPTIRKMLSSGDLRPWDLDETSFPERNCNTINV